MNILPNFSYNKHAYTFILLYNVIHKAHTKDNSYGLKPRKKRFCLWNITCGRWANGKMASSIIRVWKKETELLWYTLNWV